MPAKSFVIICLLVVPLVGCDRGVAPTRPAASSDPAADTQPVSTTQPTSRAADRLDVMEAVFRYQFDKNASGGQRIVDYFFFLSLDGNADPPPELMTRFKEAMPAVLPVSLSMVSASEGVRHKELGGRGLIFHVATVAWLDENTAVVEGGYYEASLSASGNTYRVSRTGGSWKVTNDHMNWIS